MPWGKWTEGENIDSKVKIDLNNGDMTTLTRSVEHRGNKDDYPHMSVTVGLNGDLKNAHWSESEHGPRIGTEGENPEWSKNPTVEKSGFSRDTPSIYDSHNFEKGGSEYSGWD